MGYYFSENIPIRRHPELHSKGSEDISPYKPLHLPSTRNGATNIEAIQRAYITTKLVLGGEASPTSCISCNHTANPLQSVKKLWFVVARAQNPHPNYRYI